MAGRPVEDGVHDEGYEHLGHLGRFDVGGHLPGLLGPGKQGIQAVSDSGSSDPGRGFDRRPAELGDSPAHRGGGSSSNVPAQHGHHPGEGIVEVATSFQAPSGFLVGHVGGVPSHFQEDLLLAGKMKVEGAFRDAGDLNDLLDSGLFDARFEAALRPEIEGGPNQSLTRLAGSLLTQSGAPA